MPIDEFVEQRQNLQNLPFEFGESKHSHKANQIRFTVGMFSPYVSSFIILSNLSLHEFRKLSTGIPKKKKHLIDHRTKSF